MHNNKSTMANKCTSFAGHFDGLGNPPLQSQAHLPMEVEDVLGYIRCHWTPPVGDYSHRLALAAARVIGFGTHNQGCGGEKGPSEASSKKAQNGPSTHVIDAASFVKLLHCTIGAEELSYFSSYQILTAYKNW
jgi:hypothetical protein